MHQFAVRALTLLFAFTVLSITVVSAATRATFQSDGQEEIDGACDPVKETPWFDQGQTVIVHEQGRFVDDATYAAIKDRARIDSHVPKADLLLGPEDFPANLPVTQFKFTGTNYNTQPENFRFFPPDTTMAVGPNHVLAAVNVLLRLSGKTNTNVQILSLGQFFARPVQNLFDPKVYFDPQSHRFFVVVLEVNFQSKQSFIRMAVSQSDSPASLTAGWCKYSIPSAISGSWADFPTIGMNSKWMAINVNNFNFSNGAFQFDVLRVIPVQALVTNATSCGKMTLFKFTRSDASTIQAAQQLDTSLDPTLYLISSLALTSVPVDFYSLWTITGTSKPVLTKSTFQSGNVYSPPPQAAHPNGKKLLDTGDSRILQAVVRNGKLYAVHSTSCAQGPPPNVSCIRMLEIDPTAVGTTTNPVVASLTLGAGQKKFLWNPGIAVDKNGNAVFSSQYSASTISLSTAFAGMKNGASKLDAAKILTRGACPILDLDGGGRNRTGDYTGSALDPADGSFWIGGEVAVKIGAQCEWTTSFARILYK